MREGNLAVAEFQWVLARENMESVAAGCSKRPSVSFVKGET